MGKENKQSKDHSGKAAAGGAVAGTIAVWLGEIIATTIDDGIYKGVKKISRKKQG